MPPLDFDAPGATATDSTDQPGEAVAVADEAAPETTDAGCLEELNRDEVMPNLDEECGQEIETADDSGHLVDVTTEQTTCEVWAVHDGTAWRYGLTWEHSLGSRSSPSRLMPGEGYSDARNALLAGLGIARMDMLGKDADMIVKIDTAIDELDAEGKAEETTEAVESVAEPIAVDEPKPSPPPRPQQPLDDATITLRKIAEAEAEAELASREVEARKADLKDAKEDYEAAINRLRRLSRQIVADASRPLLAECEKPKPSEVAKVNQGSIESPMVDITAPPALPPKDESWRECRFDDANEFANLPSSIVAMLWSASIETVGQLSDFQSKHGEFWAKEIKGIGKSKAEKISDAMIEFWSRHPEATGSK